MEESHKKDRQRKAKDQLNTFARFSGIGFQMLVIIGIGVWGGIKLDEIYPNRFQTFTIVCSLLGIGMALYFVIRQVNKFQNKNNRPNHE